MEHSEYFRDRVKTFLTYLPERTLNAGVDTVTTIIVIRHGIPLHTTKLPARTRLMDARTPRRTARPHRRVQVEPDERRSCGHSRTRNQGNTPHTQSDFDDLVELMYRFAINKTPIENELERRRNDNDER